ncbi:serine/threonine protein kinase [Lipingzhangella halophila]|uniref:non-specific serine/threonine protein kinase n=1 Tax=Lipingzhangella halophila TaxID=1783352 RepID=A0A7W7RP97_9ACTN|nr:serine/threonine-protein kinase [Lipingzhangella halophila]MBB4935377.1 serine/threonine protein kinase [Lipingzhangella halophila]
MSEGALEKVGRYRVDAILGVGAFATVYRATDDRLDGTVAVKVLAENHSLDPELRERFLTEGRVLRRIDSAHVIRVHDLGETDRQQPYLVLEYAGLGTLADRVSDLRGAGWRPASADLLSVVRPLASAIEAVHRANVVHRDLSPGNVLLSSSAGSPSGPPSAVIGGTERIVLADLGLCKDLAINSGYTVSGGTSGFRAPEQRGGPALIDARADLWSLSALVVWLVTGSPPEGGPVRGAIVAAGFPGALGDALDRSLSEDPGARHPDVAAWRSAIEEALSPVTPAGAPGATTTARGAASGNRPARRLITVLGSAGAAGVVALAGVLGWAWWADRTEVTSLDGGDVRVARSEGDSEVAIEGPEEISAGETATFSAELDGVSEAVWVTPEGSLHSDASGLEVATSSSGVATVTLVGAVPGGEPITVTHDLRVTE